MSRSTVSRLVIATTLAVSALALPACSSSSATPITVAPGGACETLYGTPSAVVQGLALEPADGFAWQSDIMSAEGKPMGCTLQDKPVTTIITFWINKADKKCLSIDVCSTAVNGSVIEMSVTKKGPHGVSYPKPADKDATAKWLTTVAGRI